MGKKVYKVDENGFYVEPVILQIIGYTKERLEPIYEDLPHDCVDVEILQGLYRGKWTGSEWVEDMPLDEIAALETVPRGLTDIETLRLEQAQANAEMFELLIKLIGGV